MNQHIKEERESLFIWEGKTLFNEHLIRKFIKDIASTKEYLELYGICQLTMPTSFSRKDSGTYIFTIQAHNRLRSIDTNIKFYVKDRNVIAQFCIDEDTLGHALSIFNFLENIANSHDLYEHLDNDKRNKIELKLIG